MSIQLIAKSTGFYRGNRVREGQTFAFEGDEKKIPKWAERLDALVKTPKPVKPTNGDTKPEAAIKAAKDKASGMQELV